MKTLIVYATYSGGTQLAAEIVAETLKKSGQNVTLKSANLLDPNEFNDYDLIILGSPSWLINGKQGQPHQYFTNLIDKLESFRLESKIFAVFGLGHSAYYNPFCGAVDVLEEAIKKTGGKLAGDSLRVDGFYFNQEVNENLLRTWAEKLSKNTSN